MRPIGRSGRMFSSGSPLPPAPQVLSILPTSGTTAGGTPVTITGNNFLTATSAAVGGVNLTSFVVVDDHHVTGVTGAHAAGLANVTVTSPSGTSAPLVGGYNYVAPYNPALLVATTWQEASFPVPPVVPPTVWPGSASAGPSGNRDARDFAAGVRGARGSSLNGLVSVLYDNSGVPPSTGTNSSALQYYATGPATALDIHEVVDPGPSNGGPFSYWAMGLSRIVAAAPPGVLATPYTAQCFIDGDARWGIYFDDTFIGVWHYTGAFPLVRVAHPGVGSVFKWCVRWIAGLNVASIDINTTAGLPTSLAPVLVLDGVGCLTAIDGFNTALGIHETWNLNTGKGLLADADRDGYFSYLSSVYNIP